LGAVAGEVANAIVLILACAISLLSVRFIPPVLAKNHRGAKLLSFSSCYCLPMALLPLVGPWILTVGDWNKTGSVRRWETFSNGPKSSTFWWRCNPSFTQLLVGMKELHHWW
jgi:hypothetical protein